MQHVLVGFDREAVKQRFGGAFYAERAELRLRATSPRSNNLPALLSFPLVRAWEESSATWQCPTADCPVSWDLVRDDLTQNNPWLQSPTAALGLGVTFASSSPPSFCWFSLLPLIALACGDEGGNGS